MQHCHWPSTPTSVAVRLFLLLSLVKSTTVVAQQVPADGGASRNNEMLIRRVLCQDQVNLLSTGMRSGSVFAISIDTILNRYRFVGYDSPR